MLFYFGEIEMMVKNKKLTISRREIIFFTDIFIKPMNDVHNVI